MKNYQAEIVAVGTELLLGQIANTNAQWLSEKLASYGINIYNHTVVGDNLGRVEQAFELAQSRSDIVIVTGGLGPTADDLTREGFQQMTGLALVEDQKSMEKIETFFQNRGQTMTPNNRKQARVFEGSTVLTNNAGMAPGMYVHYQSCHWFFLPGVPREMKHISQEELFPFLETLTGKQRIIQSVALKFSGIGESALEHALSDLIEKQTNPTIAPLAQDQAVVIRLTASGETKQEAVEMLEQTKTLILARIGEFCFGEDDESIEEVVVQQLKHLGYSISAAESITGGMFSQKIVSVSGASNVFAGSYITYQTRIKKEVLEIPSETIDSHGVVSHACSDIMASNVSRKMQTNLGISFTGIAGPNEQEGKPVGTVYISLVDDDEVVVSKKFNFTGNRNHIRDRACLKGFEIIYQYLKNKSIKS
ncbi:MULTISPECIES: competence/damage-inducible protein A [Oceanobacillus]|uniref:Putative competence-damage inducible protein n=1 Tax=Oceanobacillus kimchii TaxID=746691 RepID=A0ABQ5TGS0_9BACI|nr:MULTISPECIES: competence/damage-inducible protein A [Oceanobacillus]MBT2598641.1 competence/damage-inducible protein A [Oceanobacillus sp. ISL-74]MBT2651560.1 competence/damage-inducible protein A [Oceanobacillus sp. ISL-73]MCT1576209.1 competence/damage-inducible protein A [Oceanobacillus kimchii]MCT2135846.1 competence/damage-inducible protein A [Oceanobacillus kimchii]GLO66063.1 putative competence-damage inducible protein [Oceanobacillus kimchii]